MVGNGSPIKFIERVRSRLLSDGESGNLYPDSEQTIYIYGAGELGALGLDYCEACDIPVSGILDRSRSGYLRSSSGHTYAIFSPDSFDEHTMERVPVAVAIATLPFAPIRNELHGMGWKSVFPFYNLTSVPRSGHPLANGWLLGDVTKHECETVDWLCQQWSDDNSWEHYEAFLAWHRDNSELDSLFYPVDPDQRYVIPEVKAALSSRNQQLIDVGSHRGESVVRLSRAGLRFHQYILIEPDESSRSLLTLSQREIVSDGASVSVLPHVLGGSKGRSKFQDGLGYCSQVWVESNIDREVVALDDLQLNPDYLKVHTEGTEHEILTGARETIGRSRPCIAFSVYHRRRGFCEDIAGPMKMFPGYRWFFRLHSYQGTGAFVYAVPEAG